MSNNIKKFPITYQKMRKNMLGPLNVECEITGRKLHFHSKSDRFQGTELIYIDVMSMPKDSDDTGRKICELTVRKDELLEALSHITPNEYEQP